LARQDKSFVAFPLMAFASNRMINLSKSQEISMNGEFIVGPEVVFLYIAQFLAVVRITLLEEVNGSFNGAEYRPDHILWYKILPECWPAETVLGLAGQPLVDVLGTQLDADTASDRYRLAYDALWKILTSASVEKVTHG
jgi:hypothetical protein